MIHFHRLRRRGRLTAATRPAPEKLSQSGQTTFVRPLTDDRVVHSETTTQDGHHSWRHIDYWPEANALEVRMAKTGDALVVLEGAHRRPRPHK